MQTWDSHSPVGYNRFQIGYIFAEYDLFNSTTFIQNCIYTNFRINLTKFYIIFSRQEHQIEVLYILFKAWDSQVSSYTPFYFSFTVPLNLIFFNTWGEEIDNIWVKNISELLLEKKIGFKLFTSYKFLTFCNIFTPAPLNSQWLWFLRN